MLLPEGLAERETKMGKQIHYVVVADLDSGTWWVDDEMFTARFGIDEGTWNTETETWQRTDWDDHLSGLQILDAQGRES